MQPTQGSKGSRGTGVQHIQGFRRSRGAVGPGVQECSTSKGSGDPGVQWVQGYSTSDVGCAPCKSYCTVKHKNLVLEAPWVRPSTCVIMHRDQSN